MELGINTDYEAEYVKIEEIEESIRRIAGAGFSHMHWCYEWDGDYIYSRSEMEQIRGWMDKYGLRQNPCIQVREAGESATAAWMCITARIILPR